MLKRSLSIFVFFYPLLFVELAYPHSAHDPIKDIEKLNLRNVVFDGELCIVDENGDEDFQSVMKEINRKNHTVNNPLFQVFDFLTFDGFNSQEEETELGMRLNADKTEASEDIIKSSIKPDKRYCPR